MTTRCYAKMGEGLKIYEAGCVEPSTNVVAMAHIYTFFCEPEPTGQCFKDRNRDFLRRISCFQCSDSLNNDYPAPCSGPQDLPFKSRVTCPLGVKMCVTSVSGRFVERGCIQHTVGQCTKNSPLCVTCTAPYCNGLPAVNNTGKCYTTMTDLRDIHGTMLRLMSCRGMLVTAHHKPCYINQAAQSVVITAGCAEDARDTDDLVKYGDTDIIFEHKISCYKCKSERKEHCFSVRYLEPELCTAYGMAAMRGCYTLFNMEFSKIERGCLTELDDYRRHFCANEFYPELCIMCADDFCNIHDTPEEDPELLLRSSSSVERRGGVWVVFVMGGVVVWGMRLW